MRWLKAMLWGILLVVTEPVIGSGTVPEQPQDYATGVMLKSPDSGFISPWYQVRLPSDIYQHTAWPDLRDVRVFNRQGEAVPFALGAQKTAPVTPKMLPLRLFPLNISPVEEASKVSDNERSYVLRAKDGLEVYLDSDKVKEKGQCYLLALPAEMAENDRFSLAQLRLNWTTPAGNWQGNASVYYSRDLRRWDRGTEGAPLMDLTHGSDRLKIDTIGINLGLSSHGNRYLLLIVDSKSPALALQSVSAIERWPTLAQEYIALTAEGSQFSDSEAVWRWAQPQPLTSLKIELYNEGLLPVELAWRSSETGVWQPLTSTMLYHLAGKHSDDINLSGQLVEAIKMKTINAHLPDILPEITGSRARYQLVFNTQGKGPYMLAWGNRGAQKTDIRLDTLIPASLRVEQNANGLPVAVIGEPVSLGGDSRLTAISAVESDNRQKTWLVWGVLIVGVAALLLMAWKIWCDVKKEGGA